MPQKYLMLLTEILQKNHTLCKIYSIHSNDFLKNLKLSIPHFIYILSGHLRLTKNRLNHLIN